MSETIDTQGCAYSGELPPPGGLTCGHDESAPIHNPHDHRNFHHAFVSPRSTKATFDAVQWLSAHGARQHRLDHEDEAKKYYACAEDIERLRAIEKRAREYGDCPNLNLSALSHWILTGESKTWTNTTP